MVCGIATAVPALGLGGVGQFHTEQYNISIFNISTFNIPTINIRHSTQLTTHTGIRGNVYRQHNSRGNYIILSAPTANRLYKSKSSSQHHIGN
jgi:hypothetical protein